MMVLERIGCHVVELPLVHPFRTSFGEERVRRALLVSVSSGGLVGWGECVAASGPWYSYETVDTALSVIKGAFPGLLRGKGIERPGDVAGLLSPVRGHPMAKAALEAAVWDLYGRALGKPLSELIGGVRDEVPVGVSIGIQGDVESLLERIAAFRGLGYRRIKLKIEPGWDVGVLERVREEFPDLPLSVDANGAYALDDRELLGELDRFDLMMIEQPLWPGDLVGHARLAAELATPICLDESVDSPHRAWEALELSACRIINVKQGRVGGLSAALRIHELARDRDIPLWCGGMLETGIGRALNLALASLPGFVLPHDISATSRYYREDIAEPEFVLSERGTIAVPRGPGLGVEVVPERLLRYQVAACEVRL
jgi:O-succinylbenzoate synthase